MGKSKKPLFGFMNHKKNNSELSSDNPSANQQTSSNVGIPPDTNIPKAAANIQNKIDENIAMEPPKKPLFGFMEQKKNSTAISPPPQYPQT